MNKKEFQEQINFNHGYNDAANTIKNKCNNPKKFWGFAKKIGENIKDPADILDVHPNKFYAFGWIAGYNDMNLGEYKGNSEKAWNVFLIRKETGKVRVAKTTKAWLARRRQSTFTLPSQTSVAGVNALKSDCHPFFEHGMFWGIAEVLRLHADLRIATDMLISAPAIKRNENIFEEDYKILENFGLIESER